METEIVLIIAIAFIAILFLAGAVKKLPKLYHAFVVPAGYAGLLYQNSKFVERLAPGRHVRWGRNFTLDAQDTRKAFLAVAGQDVLRADNISVKLNLVVAYQIADPIKASHETQSWHAELYNIAQLALRTVVSGVAAEALLTQRLDIAPQLLSRVQPDAAKIGITVHAVEVKDVMLPAELKRAYGDVLKAKQEEIVGTGEIPADAALRFRAALMERSPKTRILTNARSSLQGGSVLLWLLGDSRTIRDDARLYFRRTTLSEDDEVQENRVWENEEPKYRDSYSEIDPEEGDYARVLQIINEFLPVKEMAGRLIGTTVLRQFGLIENEKVDNFLATVFSKSPEPAESSLTPTDQQRIQRRAKDRARQIRK